MSGNLFGGFNPLLPQNPSQGAQHKAPKQKKVIPKSYNIKDEALRLDGFAEGMPQFLKLYRRWLNVTNSQDFVRLDPLMQELSNKIGDFDAMFSILLQRYARMEDESVTEMNALKAEIEKTGFKHGGRSVYFLRNYSRQIVVHSMNAQTQESKYTEDGECVQKLLKDLRIDHKMCIYLYVKVRTNMAYVAPYASNATDKDKEYALEAYEDAKELFFNQQKSFYALLESLYEYKEKKRSMFSEHFEEELRQYYSTREKPGSPTPDELRKMHKNDDPVIRFLENLTKRGIHKKMIFHTRKTIKRIKRLERRSSDDEWTEDIDEDQMREYKIAIDHLPKCLMLMWTWELEMRDEPLDDSSRKISLALHPSNLKLPVKLGLGEANGTEDSDSPPLHNTFCEIFGCLEEDEDDENFDCWPEKKHDWSKLSDDTEHRFLICLCQLSVAFVKLCESLWLQQTSDDFDVEEMRYCMRDLSNRVNKIGSRVVMEAAGFGITGLICADMSYQDNDEDAIEEIRAITQAAIIQAISFIKNTILSQNFIPKKSHHGQKTIRKINALMLTSIYRKINETLHQEFEEDVISHNGVGDRDFVRLLRKYEDVMQIGSSIWFALPQDDPIYFRARYDEYQSMVRKFESVQYKIADEWQGFADYGDCLDAMNAFYIQLLEMLSVEQTMGCAFLDEMARNQGQSLLPSNLSQHRWHSQAMVSFENGEEGLRRLISDFHNPYIREILLQIESIASEIHKQYRRRASTEDDEILKRSLENIAFNGRKLKQMLRYAQNILRCCLIPISHGNSDARDIIMETVNDFEPQRWNSTFTILGFLDVGSNLVQGEALSMLGMLARVDSAVDLPIVEQIFEELEYSNAMNLWSPSRYPNTSEDYRTSDNSILQRYLDERDNQRQYPLTLGFLHLIASLLRKLNQQQQNPHVHRFPRLGKSREYETSKQATRTGHARLRGKSNKVEGHKGLYPYLDFILDEIFMSSASVERWIERFDSREQRWEVITCCFCVFCEILDRYEYTEESKIIYQSDFKDAISIKVGNVKVLKPKTAAFRLMRLCLAPDRESEKFLAACELLLREATDILWNNKNHSKYHDFPNLLLWCERAVHKMLDLFLSVQKRQDEWLSVFNDPLQCTNKTVRFLRCMPLSNRLSSHRASGRGMGDRTFVALIARVLECANSNRSTSAALALQLLCHISCEIEPRCYRLAFAEDEQMSFRQEFANILSMTGKFDLDIHSLPYQPGSCEDPVLEGYFYHDVVTPQLSERDSSIHMAYLVLTFILDNLQEHETTGMPNTAHDVLGLSSMMLSGMHYSEDIDWQMQLKAIQGDDLALLPLIMKVIFDPDPSQSILRSLCQEILYTLCSQKTTSSFCLDYLANQLFPELEYSSFFHHYIKILDQATQPSNMGGRYGEDDCIINIDEDASEIAWFFKSLAIYLKQSPYDRNLSTLLFRRLDSSNHCMMSRIFHSICESHRIESEARCNVLDGWKCVIFNSITFGNAQEISKHIDIISFVHPSAFDAMGMMKIIPPDESESLEFVLDVIMLTFSKFKYSQLRQLKHSDVTEFWRTLLEMVTNPISASHRCKGRLYSSLLHFVMFVKQDLYNPMNSFETHDSQHKSKWNENKREILAIFDRYASRLTNMAIDDALGPLSERWQSLALQVIVVCLDFDIGQKMRSIISSRGFIKGITDDIARVSAQRDATRIQGNVGTSGSALLAPRQQKGNSSISTLRDRHKALRSRLLFLTAFANSENNFVVEETDDSTRFRRGCQVLLDCGIISPILEESVLIVQRNLSFSVADRNRLIGRNENAGSWLASLSLIVEMLNSTPAGAAPHKLYPQLNKFALRFMSTFSEKIELFIQERSGDRGVSEQNKNALISEREMGFITCILFHVIKSVQFQPDVENAMQRSTRIIEMLMDTQARMLKILHLFEYPLGRWYRCMSNLKSDRLITERRRTQILFVVRNVVHYCLVRQNGEKTQSTDDPQDNLHRINGTIFSFGLDSGLYHRREEAPLITSALDRLVLCSQHQDDILDNYRNATFGKDMALARECKVQMELLNEIFEKLLWVCVEHIKSFERISTFSEVPFPIRRKMETDISALVQSQFSNHLQKPTSKKFISKRLEELRLTLDSIEQSWIR